MTELYGQRLRVRVCGLYREDDRLLMVKHRGVGTSGTFWSPPGGGIEFGETVPVALQREVQEETGLIVEAGRLVCVHDFVAPPLHAIELFFEIQRVSGQLLIGSDPEMNDTDQLILDVRLMTFEQIKALPANDVHSLFSRCHSLEEVFGLSGYIN
ncbi:MAG: NUDIX hydrolase [Cytophagaceae bacterium]|nr:MAG: NUDIX hydrolase [Cytophagaceae bacterium]